MKKLLLMVVVVLGALGLAGSTMAATAPTLGVANSYAVWGKAGVSNDLTATTHIWGNVGADLMTNITNLVSGQVDGTIIAPTPAEVQTAISDAYTALSTPPQEAATIISLAGIVTIAPGVYTVSAAEVLNDTVTLSGAGVYIFRSTSAFTVAPSARVLLTNGASACDVFWQIYSSMSIGTNAEMVGTIITSQEAITLGVGASLQGRVLSTIAAVTLDSNQITAPICTSTLKVVKEVVGGTAVASDFNMHVILSGGTDVAGSPASGTASPGTSYSLYTLNPTTYIISEDANIDYTQSFTGDCDANGNVTLSAGLTKTCTVINTYIIPTPSGGGGGGSTLSKDYCPNGDYSTSYYDGICGLLPAAATQSIHIVKVANRLTPFPYGGGDVIYTYAVTNPDTTPISDVAVTDDKCSPLASIGGDINNDNLLDTDEVWTYTCSTNISVTTKNVATVIGKANGVTVTDTDFANVVVGSLHNAAPIVPMLPKTGAVTEGKIISWNIIMLVTILMIVSISGVIAFRKVKA